MTPDAAFRLDLIRLARSEGIGPTNFPRFLRHYGTPEAAIAALPERARLAGRARPPRIPGRGEIEDEIAATERIGGRIVVQGDRDYPLLLGHIPDAPAVFSVLGDLSLASRASVAIVGARRASAAGTELATSFARDLSCAGVCVVSGLALGIDAAAHEGALQGMPMSGTIAAVAGGLNTIYPRENAPLFARIAESGCIVTEAPLGTSPTARLFPRRNRLIAGMTLGTVVIEAAERSGTLITARLALEYQREVFAVPGSPLDARSRGGNRLLRDGATLAESGQDVLDSLSMALPDPAPPPWAAPAPPAPGFAEDPAGWEDGILVPARHMRMVHALLSPVPVTVDAIVERCQFSVSAAMAALSELELAGQASFLPGGRVVVRTCGRQQRART